MTIEQAQFETHNHTCPYCGEEFECPDSPCLRPCNPIVACRQCQPVTIAEHVDHIMRVKSAGRNQ